MGKQVLTTEVASSLAHQAELLANMGTREDAVALMLVAASGYGLGVMDLPEIVAVLTTAMFLAVEPWRAATLLTALRQVQDRLEN